MVVVIVGYCEIVVTIGVAVVGFGIFDHFAIPFAVWIVPAL